MKDELQALFPMSDDEFEDCFNGSVIVLDTNVLLDLYRYSRRASNQFLSLLTTVEGQLWMPHHVGWEFLRARPEVRQKLTKVHTDRIKLLSDLDDQMGQQGQRNHVGGEPEEARFLRALKRYQRHLDGEREELRLSAKSTTDLILSRIQALYTDRTQSRPDEAWYDEHTKSGAERYKEKTPPGYKDANKDSNPYGDYFVWAQCIEYANDKQKPLVMVTGDLKSDWWQHSAGERLGPDHQLQEEFYNKTGQRLIMFDTRQFFRYLGNKQQEDSGTTDDLDRTENEIAAVQSETARNRARTTVQMTETLMRLANEQSVRQHALQDWVASMDKRIVNPLRTYTNSIALDPRLQEALRRATSTDALEASIYEKALRDIVAGNNAPQAAPEEAGEDEDPDD